MQDPTWKITKVKQGWGPGSSDTASA
jgi:hypothetical protein